MSPGKSIRIIAYLFLINLFLVKNVSFSQSYDTNGFSLKWKLQTDSTLHTITILDTNAFIISDSTGLLTKIDFSGDSLWQNDAFGTLSNNLSVSRNGIIVTATSEGDIITFDENSGDQIQSIGLDVPITAGPVLYSYKGKKNLITNSGNGQQTVIVVGTGKGEILCYDLNSLEEIWKYSEPGNGIPDNLIFVNNKLIFSSKDGYIYCLDANEGWLIWKWKYSSKKKHEKIVSNLLHDKNFLYFTLSNGKLYKVDLLVGKTIWISKNKAGKGKITFFNNKYIFSSGRKSKVIILSSITGKIEKYIKYPEKGFTISTQILQFDKSLILGTNNGLLYEFNKYQFKRIFDNHKVPIKMLIKLNTSSFLFSDKTGKVNLIWKN